jgi:hypothetical protein
MNTNTITAQDAPHAETINQLARDNAWSEIGFVHPLTNALLYANSIWALSEYWKREGLYNRNLAFTHYLVK